MSKQEIEQLKTRLESLRQTAVAESEKESSQIVTNNDSIKEELPWTSSERQQGEVCFILLSLSRIVFIGFFRDPNRAIRTIHPPI